MGEVASQRVVVIGAGRVATHLAPALLRAGHKLQQVWSRTEDSARQLAEPWGISYTSDLAAVVTDADVYIFCVSDSALPEVAARLDIPREKFAFISGIGCSSRFVYYMNTYGFHSIHGRAAAISTGLKTARPDLSVWVCSGDGDSLAIGGNHFIHACRRNIDLNLILFNNEIYGLTKGQYSPTSPKGFVSKSSPFGTVERPFIPAELVFGARGTFFARTLDVDMLTTVDCMVQGHQHKGASVIECLVNCVIFNNGTHSWIADREMRAERSIVLKHGEKMIFGKEKDKGLALDYSQGLIPQLIIVPADDPRVLTHDATMQDPTLHRMLAMMGQDIPASSPNSLIASSPQLPIALGVIRNVEEESYDMAVNQQINEVREKSKAKTFDQLTATLEQWEI